MNDDMGEFSLSLFYLKQMPLNLLGRCGHGPNYCVLMRSLTSFWLVLSSNRYAGSQELSWIYYWRKIVKWRTALQPTLHIDCCYPHQSVSRSDTSNRKIWLISKFKALSFRLCVCYTVYTHCAHEWQTFQKNPIFDIHISLRANRNSIFHSFFRFIWFSLSFPFPGNRNARPKYAHRCLNSPSAMGVRNDVVTSAASAHHISFNVLHASPANAHALIIENDKSEVMTFRWQ